jgi:hypothetical protein
MMRQNGRGELLYLGKCFGLPAKRLPRNGCGLDAATYGKIAQGEHFARGHNALANPTHAGDSHAIAQGFVSRPVWALVGRLVAPRNKRVIVLKALQSLTFSRGKTADGHALRWVYNSSGVVDVGGGRIYCLRCFVSGLVVSIDRNHIDRIGPPAIAGIGQRGGNAVRHNLGNFHAVTGAVGKGYGHVLRRIVPLVPSV